METEGKKILVNYLTDAVIICIKCLENVRQLQKSQS